MVVDVSILIACFEKEAYLEECLESVRRQTKQPKEIILVHDKCENPSAHALADTIILRDHVGVARVRSEAFRYSTGKLVLFLDGDDALSPDYLEKMIPVLSEGADIVYPDTYFWDWQGNNSSLFITPDLIDTKYVNEHKKTTLPVTCLMRREIFEELKGFRELPVLEDLDFFLRAMVNHYTFRKAQTLLWYRQGQDTRNRFDERSKKPIHEQIFSQFELTDESIKYAEGLH